MTTSAYIDWFRNLLIPSLPEERPVLLILDGHSSHVSHEVRQLAIENQVHMLKLPPHLTHLLQPLDISVFKPMKATYYSAVADFTRKERRALTKRSFPEVMAVLWSKFNPETAKGGFRGCGIHPFDSSVVPVQSTRYSEPFSASSSSSQHSSQSSNQPQQVPSVVQSLLDTCDSSDDNDAGNGDHDVPETTPTTPSRTPSAPTQ